MTKDQILKALGTAALVLSVFVMLFIEQTIFEVIDPYSIYTQCGAP